MERNFNYSNSKLDKVMTTEQFDRIVDAILSGKYSWACLLILRFAGYNPLHYIPYRTYNRIMKENSLKNNSQLQSAIHKSKIKTSRKLRDLACLEDVGQSAEIMGGTRAGSLPEETSSNVIYASRLFVQSN